MKRLFAVTTLSVIISFVGAIATTHAALGQDAGEIARAAGGADCPSCNLFQADFSYHDLEGRNFAGARLRQADLSLSTMNRSNFEGADLSVANAFGGRFTHANFTGADLTNAAFIGAYLGYADFANATLSGASFAGAELNDAQHLTQAQLNTACGDERTLLPAGLTIPDCG